MRIPSLALAACLALSGASHAEPSLQQQIEELQKQVQYIKDNYERTEPVEIVKPVTEYVSPTGELFTSPQPGGVSPTDGSKLEERVSYRKLKFNRREAVGEKIDSAVNAAIDGHVVVGLELLGQYQNTLGAGDSVDATGVTRSANRGWGTGGVDVVLTGKPMRNTLMFVDLDAASGAPALSEAWVSLQGPRKVLSLQAGVVDLTGSFDGNKAANDETTQFMHPSLVNSALLQNPANGPGAVLRADLTRYHLALGAQSSIGASADAFDSLYWAGELGLLYNLLGDGHARVWARQLPRGDQQPDQALGVSWDHRLGVKTTLFGRYAKSSYVEAYDAAADARYALNSLDWSASGGVELSYLLPRRLRDKVGLGYGRNERQDRSSEQFAEAYYKASLTPNVSVSLDLQGTFSRTVADAGAAALDPATGDPKLNDALPNAWSAGIRTLVAY